jgi:hypothetical protein
MLTRTLEPVFEKRFSPYSFACRKGFGTHAALSVARDACAEYRYALKCDIRKYFASIDHEILMAKLAEAVKCLPTLDLARRVIDGFIPQEAAEFYFPGDDLFSPFERRRGPGWAGRKPAPRRRCDVFGVASLSPENPSDSGCGAGFRGILSVKARWPGSDMPGVETAGH